jgi:hypothetical protein
MNDRKIGLEEGRQDANYGLAATQNMNLACIIYSYFLIAVSVMFNLINSPQC